MTEQLEKAWKALSKPFHNETIYTEDLVPAGALQAFVNSIVRHIDLYYPGNSLFLFDDWHAHDGFIVPATPCPSGSWLSTSPRLIPSTNGVREISRSIAPFIRTHLISCYASTF